MPFFFANFEVLWPVNFSHRRQWVLERMHFLASLFNIDICAYAIMSNHYHLVLHADIKANQNLSNKAVYQRWCQLYSAPPLVTDLIFRTCFKNKSACNFHLNSQ